MQGESPADTRNSIRTYCEFIKMVYRKLLSLLGKMRSQIVGPDSLMMGHLCFTEEISISFSKVGTSKRRCSMPVEYVSAGHSGLAPPPSKVHEHGLPKKDVQCMFIEYGAQGGRT